MNHNGIERVFDFVRDAGSDARKINQTLRLIELRFELGDRFAVMQEDERADCFASVRNRLD